MYERFGRRDLVTTVFLVQERARCLGLSGERGNGKVSSLCCNDYRVRHGSWLECQRPRKSYNQIEKYASTSDRAKWPPGKKLQGNSNPLSSKLVYASLGVWLFKWFVQVRLKQLLVVCVCLCFFRIFWAFFPRGNSVKLEDIAPVCKCCSNVIISATFTALLTNVKCAAW